MLSDFKGDAYIFLVSVEKVVLEKKLMYFFKGWVGIEKPILFPLL